MKIQEMVPEKDFDIITWVSGNILAEDLRAAVKEGFLFFKNIKDTGMGDYALLISREEIKEDSDVQELFGKWERFNAGD